MKNNKKPHIDRTNCHALKLKKSATSFLPNIKHAKRCKERKKQNILLHSISSPHAAESPGTKTHRQCNPGPTKKTSMRQIPTPLKNLAVSGIERFHDLSLTMVGRKSLR
jgi:hypothetical protein